MHTISKRLRNFPGKARRNAQFLFEYLAVTKGNRQRRLSMLVAVGYMGMLSGCGGGGMMNLKKHGVRWANARSPAYRALSVWQPAEGWGVDNRPTRGFAGQIYFFTKDVHKKKDGNAPVAVRGEVRIFVFDDQGTPEEQSRPIHQFVFEDGVWDKYLYDTQLGPAYNIFIPYTRKGYHKAECALRVRLTPPDGPVIYSKMVNVSLPGTTKTDTNEKSITTAATAESDRVPSENKRRRLNVKTSRYGPQDAVRHTSAVRGQFSPNAVDDSRSNRIEEFLQHRVIERTQGNTQSRRNSSTERPEEPMRLPDQTAEGDTDGSETRSSRRFRLNPVESSRAISVHPLADESRHQPATANHTRVFRNHPLSTAFEDDEAHPFSHDPSNEAAESASTSLMNGSFMNHAQKSHPLIAPRSSQYDQPDRTSQDSSSYRRKFETYTIPLPR